MQQDLDSLMNENKIDAILITGPAFYNPTMVYMTGGGHVTHADLIKKVGEPAILFHGAMERDEAAKSGLKTISFSNYPVQELFKEANNEPLQAYALRYSRMLKDAGVTKGKIALYGVDEVGEKFAIFNALKQYLPDVEIVGFSPDPIFMQAMMTKDNKEIERIRAMGVITTGVVARVADFLTSQQVTDNHLVNQDGSLVTIGQVKSKINLWLAEAGVENPEGTIFAIGRDSGVPHSTGTNTDLLELGKTIVFDIFPCETGGGYYYDFTRTWSLGYATEEAQKLYDQVKEVYQKVEAEFKLDAPFIDCHIKTCELFEAMGHPTVLSTPETEVGLVHSLGHGVGLHIHESPFSRAIGGKSDVLAAGSVFTSEPGLYYPERGLGVRIENTYWMRPDGKAEILVDYPYDFVLKMKS
ncbi:MAG: M24 family metallopeptidase [Anaerolineaceae bacterium]